MASMPDQYRGIPEPELIKRIEQAKSALKDELLILSHHYQRQEIVELGDIRGDSFELSKKAAQNDGAKYIVFCGVHFMAESAAVLARPGQAVLMPSLRAGCPMADMADEDEVERAWQELSRHADPKSVMPVTYVNSTAGVKAFCGRMGGAACTSSNAHKLVSWALEARDKVFFLPDEHLGTNTAARLSIGPVALWDPDKDTGGLSPAEISSARVIVWKGYCHVHTRFTTGQVEKAREQYPGCRVVVHPECTKEVVQAADRAGSTSEIIRCAQEQPRGSTIVVGTEINLVTRLAKERQDQKTVVPLERSLCPNMFRINLANLCWVVESIVNGEEEIPNRVEVKGEQKNQAAKALYRMIEVSG